MTLQLEEVMNNVLGCLRSLYTVICKLDLLLKRTDID